MVLRCTELAIHSANRVVGTTSQTVNDYTWEVGRTLKNVASVEVLYAEIPNSYYNVPDGANAFTITLNATDYTIYLTPGNYSSTDIAAAMNAKLAGVTISIGSYTKMSEMLSFTVDTITDQLTLTHLVSHAISGGVESDNFPYALGWISNHTWTAFVANDVYSSGGTLRLAAESVLYLSIPQLGHHGTKYQFGTNSSKGIPIQAEQVLTHFSTSGSINYMNHFTNEHNMHERHFDGYPPLHLSSLTIRFLRPDGRLIHFNGYDHSLHLRVVYDE